MTTVSLTFEVDYAAWREEYFTDETNSEIDRIVEQRLRILDLGHGVRVTSVVAPPEPPVAGEPRRRDEPLRDYIVRICGARSGPVHEGRAKAGGQGWWCSLPIGHEGHHSAYLDHETRSAAHHFHTWEAS